MNKLNEKERIRINCENYIKNEDYIKKWSNKNNGNKKFNLYIVYESWDNSYSKFYQKYIR